MTSADSSVAVPPAPAFLDPLVDIESCYYYAVPTFFSFHHPNTRWLIAMIKGRAMDRVRRKMELNPELFKGKYFQMMDYPKLYFPQNPSVTPMFKRQTVLYLSVLGMSIYLRSLPLIDLILFHKDPYDEALSNVNEPQFASHLQDLKYGDFHAFPPCLIMLRMYCFESAVSLLQAGWDPTLPLALPMRRRFERRAFYFHDWLEAALGLLSERPLYPLQSLVLNMTRNMMLYRFLQLPLTHLLPPTPKERVPTGLVDVEELPLGIPMTGVRSLLQMAEDYDRYLQMRSCALEVSALKREAVAVGLNPEILMIQAMDYDGYVAEKSVNQECASNAWRGGRLGTGSIALHHWAVGPDTRQVVNANNSATGAEPRNTNAAASKKKELQPNYASEACRVMHYAMEKDKSCKRMQVCLDSISVLTRRGFFVNNEHLSPESLRARDIRNVIILMLNMLQREYEKLEVIFAKIQSGYKKFQHLDEHKMLENRRLAVGFNVSKIVATITRVLLHSKELVFFVGADFPPYSAGWVDFKLEAKLVNKFNEIKGGVVQEFNSIQDGWTHLTTEMIEEVAKIKSMQLHLKVGSQPTAEAVMEAKKAARKSAMKNRSKNMSNTNSCFVTFKKVQRASRRRCGIESVNHCVSTDSTKHQPPPDALPTSCDLTSDLLDYSAFTCSSEGICQDTLDSLPLVRLDAAADGADDIGATSATTDEEVEAEDARFIEDIVDDCEALSQTGLMMSNLCREVEDLLKPRRSCSDGLTTSNAKDTEDVATIEPDPQPRELNSCIAFSLNRQSDCKQLCPQF